MYEYVNNGRSTVTEVDSKFNETISGSVQK